MSVISSIKQIRVAYLWQNPLEFLGGLRSATGGVINGNRKAVCGRSPGDNEGIKRLLKHHRNSKLLIKSFEKRILIIFTRKLKLFRIFCNNPEKILEN